MNATIRVGVLLTLFGPVSAAEPQVRVASSRELRLAVVDSNKGTEAREAMHQAFATSLGSALTAQCGGAVGVKSKRVGADHAAFNLGAGVYDAALVIGRDIASALRHVDAITLSASPDGNHRERMLFLVIANGDASLQGMLATAFTRALDDEQFLERLAIAEGRRSTPTGEKIAAAR